MGFEEDLLDIGNGIRSGLPDALNWAGDLGASVGKVSASYAVPVGDSAETKILSATRLVIEAEKATTGAGAPEDGTGYRESASRLEECVETLIDADPHPDRWDGKAASTYQGTNGSHRSLVSKIRNADHHIATILALEADQVSQARHTLDETLRHLSDHGLATAIMSSLPGAAAAKLAADAAAASAALATTNSTMTNLVTNSAENALRIRGWIDDYTEAAKDDSGAGGTFVVPSEDIGQGTRPTRLNSSQPPDVPAPMTATVHEEGST